MYNKQDFLRMVFTSLLDGTLTTTSAPRLEAWTDLKDKVIIPLFKFIEKYTVFPNVGYSTVPIKELTDIFNKCLYTYKKTHLLDCDKDVTEEQVVELFENMGVKCKDIKGKKVAIYINKKITQMMQDTLAQ